MQEIDSGQGKLHLRLELGVCALCLPVTAVRPEAFCCEVKIITELFEEDDMWMRVRLSQRDASDNLFATKDIKENYEGGDVGIDKVQREAVSQSPEGQYVIFGGRDPGGGVHDVAIGVTGFEDALR